MRRVALLYSVILTRERRLTSAELMALAAEAKLENPRTVLSTGNLIFTAEAPESELESRIEAAVARHFGRPIPVLVRDADSFRSLVAENPFPEESRADPARVAARVLRHPPTEAAIARITAIVGPGERFAAGDRALWLATADRLSSSPLIRAVSAPWAGTGTLRNASALSKIAAALD